MCLWRAIADCPRHPGSAASEAEVLLCGYPPFFGDTDADVLAKAPGQCIRCEVLYTDAAHV